MLWTSHISTTTDDVISKKEMSQYYKADQQLTASS